MARLITFLAIIGIALICTLAEEDTYSNQYDDIDPLGILENRKLRVQYYNCFIGKGPCVTADAKFFKEIFAEAIPTECKRCTDKQKHILEVTADWYMKNQPDDWQALIVKSLERATEKKS